MNEQNYNPMNLGKFKNAVEKKLAGDHGEREWNRNPTIENIKLEGIKQTLFVSEGNVPYFLQDLEELKLSSPKTDYDEDYESEGWKSIGGGADMSVIWQEEIEAQISKDPARAFKIDLPYDTRQELEKKGVLPKGAYMSIYYLPKDLEKDVAKYNVYAKEKQMKDAEQAFANNMSNINLN